MSHQRSDNKILQGWIYLSELKNYYVYYKPEMSFRSWINKHGESVVKDLWSLYHILGKKGKVVKTFIRKT